MTICERIFDLLEKENATQKSLALAIGAAPQTLHNWKIRNTDPDAKYIPAIAAFFGRSEVYILTGEENPTLGINSEDQELLSIYHLLTVSGQRQLLGKAYELLDAQQASVKGGNA